MIISLNITYHLVCVVETDCTLCKVGTDTMCMGLIFGNITSMWQREAGGMTWRPLVPFSPRNISLHPLAPYSSYCYLPLHSFY